MTLRSLKVIRKTQLTDGVIEFEFADPIGSPLVTARPGSHIDVHLPSGAVRQYSLVTDGEEYGSYKIAVLLEETGRGGSVEMHRKVSEGDLINVSEPRNNFSLKRDAKRFFFYAGGIGITPIISMARKLHRDNQSFKLTYCARSVDYAPYLSEVSSLGGDDGHKIHLDSDNNGEFLDFSKEIKRYQPGDSLYVCGPKAFMDAVLKGAACNDWPSDSVFKESFTSVSGEADDNTAFKLHIRSTGEEVEVGVNETIVSALKRLNLHVPTSCENGICGTCLLRVSRGTPMHKDTFLTDKEHEAGLLITPCCSRANGDFLELDFEPVTE